MCSVLALRDGLATTRVDQNESTHTLLLGTGGFLVLAAGRSGGIPTLGDTSLLPARDMLFGPAWLL